MYFKNKFKSTKKIYILLVINNFLIAKFKFKRGDLKTTNISKSLLVKV